MPSETGRLVWRLAWRHHPLCGYFRSDAFGPVCSGCAMFWPAFWIATPPVLIALVGGASAWAMLMAGAVLGSGQLAGAVRRFSRPTRAAIKLLGGVAVAMALPAVAFLPLPWSSRGVLWGAMVAAFTGLMAIRARTILRTCDACPWQRDWAHCPGFRTHPD